MLVIHGTEDEVIDFSHGLAIYERCPRAVEPLWVEVRSGYNKHVTTKHCTVGNVGGQPDILTAKIRGFVEDCGSLWRCFDRF